MKGITIERDIVEHFSVFHARVLKVRNRNIKERLTTVFLLKESNTALASVIVNVLAIFMCVSLSKIILQFI